MKRFYRLLHYEVYHLLKYVAVISIALIASSLWLIGLELKNYSFSNTFERYEHLYTNSGSVWLFTLAFIALLLVIAYSFQVPFSKRGRSIYTLLTLPLHRSFIYFAKLLAAFIAILLLYCAQLITFIAGYYMMEMALGNYNNGILSMDNGLYLAFLRLPLFHLLWPKTPLVLFVVVSSCLVLITAIMRTILHFISDRHLTTHLFLLPVIISFTHLFLDLRVFPIYYDERSMIINAIVLTLASLFFIWDSLQLIRKGAVV
ncbi:hypothetical protein ACFSTH_10045 [Paenibacillus yanchengensis]|uniref:ABC transporter permease n=1 Tax=Paenibacillus yanchengensis TaxID=2035833 RepID=A0ABW4YNX5_9BACL